MNILRFWTEVQYMCEKPLSLTMCSFTKRNILTHWTCRLMNKNTMGGGAVADSFNTGPNHFRLNLSPNNQLPSYRCAWGTRSSKSRMTRFRSKGAAQGSDHCDMMCSNIWVWYLWMLLNVYITVWIIMCDFHFDIYLLTPFSHYEVHLFLQVLLPSCRVLPPSTFITVGLFMFNPRL